MSQPEFETLLQPLFDEYGRQYYGPKRCTAIWLALKHEPREWIKRVVEACFESEATAPMKRDLVRISDELREADARAAKLLESEPELIETPEQHAARIAENVRKAAELAEQLRVRAPDEQLNLLGARNV